MSFVTSQNLIGHNSGKVWSSFVLSPSLLPPDAPPSALGSLGSGPIAAALSIPRALDSSSALSAEVVSLDPSSQAATSQRLWLADSLLRPLGSSFSASVASGLNPLTLSPASLSFGDLQLPLGDAAYVVLSPASFGPSAQGATSQLSYLNRVASQSSWLSSLSIDYSALGWALFWTVLLFFVIALCIGLVRFGWGILKTVIFV